MIYNIILIIFIIFIIICLFLYLYVKSESFFSIPINTIPSTTLISSQLTSAIAYVIGVSPRRISDLVFTGDISKQQLTVYFTILEANLSELSNNEMKANDATTFSNGLFNAGNFIVKINNQSVLLNQDQTHTATTIPNYFNNNSMITIANYATNKYISVPNDASYTNFYKLDIDNNYNVKPSLITIPFSASSS
jgi:hypothetical protein